MVNERILEAFEYACGKGLKFVFRKVESLHEFLIHGLADILAYYFVLTCIAYDVDT